MTLRPAAVALLALLLFPIAAHAHGVLRRSVPAAGARLDEVPRQIRLTFNEAPTLAFTRVALRAATGADIRLASVRIETDSVAVADIVTPLAPGEYVIAWQVAGADGHPVRGEFRFSVAPGAAGSAPATDSIGGEAGALVPAPGAPATPAAHHAPRAADTATFDAESPAFVAVRALLYFGLVVTIGAVAFRGLVVRRGPIGPEAAAIRADATHRAATIGMWAARVTLLASALRLLAQSMAMHGDEALALPLVGTMVTQTLWGWGWVAQVLAAIAAERAFHRARRDTAATRASAPTGAWSIATAAVAVLAVTPSLASHAAAAERFMPAAVVADALHVVAAGAWMGGLALLLLAGLPSARAAERRLDAFAGLVRAFSPVALAAAATLAVTGTFAAWLHIGTLQALTSLPYGRVLLIKLGTLAAVAALGFVNWRFVLPVLHSDAGLRRFRRSGMTELAVGALVIVATAVLVALPTK